MRALVVGAVAQDGDPRMLARLAGHCGTVVAADGGGAACLAAGIVPTVVVGDLDSLGAADATALQEAGARFKTVSTYKDVTDLDLAIQEARALGADEVWATGVLGSRVDHTLAAIGTFAREVSLRPRAYERGLSAWFLSPAGEATLRLQGEGSLVSLFALGDWACVSCEGFRYPLSREDLRGLDSRGLSNVIESTETAVTVHDGIVLAVSISTDGVGPARDEAFERVTE